MTRVHFLIYDLVEVLDFTGPFDVFSMANIAAQQAEFEMFTISPNGDPIETLHGLSIVPNHSIGDSPLNGLGNGKSDTPDDILIIPGGAPRVMLSFAETYPDVIDWIMRTRDRVSVLATVCIGALIGAKAGIFSGLNATTHHNFFDRLGEFSDGEATVIAGARYTDNPGSPRTLSSAGVSAGIDMAFYLLGALKGSDLKHRTMAVMEYNGTSNWVHG